MTQKICSTILSLVLALMFTSCAAVQVAPLDISATIDGMKSAAVGAPGTWAFTKAGTDFVVLGWAQNSRYAFILLDKAGQLSQLQKLCHANVCNWRTAADFVSWLEANGWASIPAGALPLSLTEAIKTSAFQAMLGRLYTPLLVPILIPANPAELVRPMVAQ